MRKLRRGASPGDACAWSCPNAGVKHLGESWAQGVAVRWPSLTDALKPLRLADCQCDIPFSASQVQQIQTWYCEFSQFGCANGFAKHCTSQDSYRYLEILLDLSISLHARFKRSGQTCDHAQLQECLSKVRDIDLENIMEPVKLSLSYFFSRIEAKRFNSTLSMPKSKGVPTLPLHRSRMDEFPRIFTLQNLPYSLWDDTKEFILT